MVENKDLNVFVPNANTYVLCRISAVLVCMCAQSCAAYQALLSMGFFWQQHWSGLPFLTSGELPDPGVNPASPALTSDFFTTVLPGKPSAAFFI